EEEGADVGVLHASELLPELGHLRLAAPLRGRGRRRRVLEVGGVGLALELLEPFDGELGLALERGHLALDPHPIPDFEEGRELLHALPDAGVHLAGPVLEQDAEEGLLRSADARLLAGDEEDAGGRLPDLQVLDPKPVHRSSETRGWIRARDPIKSPAERTIAKPLSAGSWEGRGGVRLRGWGRWFRGGRGPRGS